MYHVKFVVQRQAVLEAGIQVGLPEDPVDLGYRTHLLLRALFGSQAPRPFVARPYTRDSVLVEGYSEVGVLELQQTAEATADPFEFAAVVWDRAADKPVSSWESGQSVGFTTLLCPTVQVERREIDAFLRRRDRSLDRENVYCSWLTRRLGDAASLALGTMSHFSVRKLVRRSQGDKRKARTFSFGVAMLNGVLNVSDGAAFDALLRKGVGRHTAFGFGMLKLRAT
jgi:CRISPR system Cascade subunit CasE